MTNTSAPTKTKEAINPDSFAFSDDGPSKAAQLSGGTRYSPYAVIVERLVANPGKWAKAPKSASKAADVHKTYAGIQRIAEGDVLWLRYVTPEIIADELIEDSGLEGPKAVLAKRHLVRGARIAGEGSEKEKDGKVTQTKFFVTDMISAARAMLQRVLQGEDLTHEADEYEAGLKAEADPPKAD